MTSIAILLAALLAFQGATPSPARECEPADNRCKAALFERRAAAAASPKSRALYLHVYWLSVNETGGWVDERRGWG